MDRKAAHTQFSDEQMKSQISSSLAHEATVNSQATTSLLVLLGSSV